MKVVAIIVVVLLLVGAGYYLLMGRSQNGPSDQPGSGTSQIQQSESSAANSGVAGLETELNELGTPSSEIDFTAIDQDLNNL